MKTPVLPLSKQNQALSAKKKKVNNVTIKNILVSPYTNYWPIVKENDCFSLKKILEENLIIIKPPKAKIPWKELEKIPREDRKTFRSNYADDSPQEATDDKLVAFGINEVTKLLENNAAASILLTKEIQPQLMVKHIIDEAVLKSVPLLVVSNLKTLLREKTGIGSLAFAIKNCSSKSNYRNIIKKVKELSLKYPVPYDHVNSLNKLEPSVDPKLFQNNLIKNEVKCTSESESEEEENLHLSRTSKSCRAFELEQKQKESKKRLLDFVEFEDATPVIVKKPMKSVPKPKISYKSLLIKRVTNNPNRSKKEKL